MRLLRLNDLGELSLTQDLSDPLPPYAILSHTWGDDLDEVSFADLEKGQDKAKAKAGYIKIRFCGEQARKDSIAYFWVDTCCINKASHVELSEAITSMFRWYRNAVKCYVYMSDVSVQNLQKDDRNQFLWETSFRKSRWFTRGWTLQELLAPDIVEFFSVEQALLGDKKMLAQQIHEITKIPLTALHGTALSEFSIAERMRWAEMRQTKKKEDQAYCLLGVFDVFMPLIYGEGDHAFIRLQKAISERSEPPKQHDHAHWLVPRSAHPLFTGRQEILRELDIIVREAINCPWSRPQCRIVISGMGGQGKSEICLQLARRLRQIFGAVLWIDISTKDIAERSFLDVAQKLSISAHTWQDACIGIANLKYPWLLMLDNADHPDMDYADYFPDAQCGVIIMTTRNKECQQYGTDRVIALEGLDDADARDLLLKAARLRLGQHGASIRDAQEVVDLLQSHPLALLQAGAYIARGHCALAEYPRLYEQQRRRLLTFRPLQAQSRHRDIYTTFEISVNMLMAIDTQAAQDAVELLSLLSVYGCGRLPLILFETAWQEAQLVPSTMSNNTIDNEVQLFTPWHVAHLPSFLNTANDTWDSFRLTEAIALLESFSLISIDRHGDTSYISTHCLIHAWARDRQDLGSQGQTWLRAGCIMAFAVDSEFASRAFFRSLQMHVEALTDRPFTDLFAVEPSILIARILVRCGWYLYYVHASNQLFALIQKIFFCLGIEQRKFDQSWLGLFELAALNRKDCGKVKEAIILLEDIEKIRQRSGSVKDLLSTQHGLAQAYLDDEQVKEAIELFEEVVRVEEQLLAKDDFSRLESQHELARAYRKNGQIMEAIELLEEVVRIKKNLLAGDDTSRLASVQVLAQAYRANGQIEEAIELLEEVVRTDKRLLVQDDGDRLSSQHDLATMYQANGQMKEAIELLEEVVRIKEQVLAEEDPSRLVSQSRLAKCLWHTGERQSSLTMMTHVVSVRRRVLPEDDPIRQRSEERLANMQHEMTELDTI